MQGLCRGSLLVQGLHRCGALEFPEREADWSLVLLPRPPRLRLRRLITRLLHDKGPERARDRIHALGRALRADAARRADDVHFLEMAYELVQVHENEPAAGVVAALGSFSGVYAT